MRDSLELKYYRKFTAAAAINQKQILLVYFGAPIGFWFEILCIMYLFRGFDILFKKGKWQHWFSSQNYITFQTE